MKIRKIFRAAHLMILYEAEYLNARRNTLSILTAIGFSERRLKKYSPFLHMNMS
jgi:hypothetical protein